MFRYLPVGDGECAQAFIGKRVDVPIGLLDHKAVLAQGQDRTLRSFTKQPNLKRYRAFMEVQTRTFAFLLKLSPQHDDHRVSLAISCRLLETVVTIAKKRIST